ncbi:hypothetical protein LP421_03500 (plasmid) [Rhizobium sp. RCAM05350]|nr:hypothetical protein LP421_03500 [Rhizobium sp. RCAM05350]
MPDEIPWIRQKGRVFSESSKAMIDRRVDIRRLGAEAQADFLDSVDSVWTAPVKGNNSRRFVGWCR